jgi:hypothetical protein
VCYLIHLGVPESSADAVPPGRVPRIARQNNPSIAAAFGRSYVLFSITDGGCACALHSARAEPGETADVVVTKRRKYERRGWSEAKIERALAASDAARAPTVTGGISKDVAALIAGIARAAGEIRLLVHAYHGRFAEEPVVPVAVKRVHVNAFETSAHAAVAEDTVYAIGA